LFSLATIKAKIIAAAVIVGAIMLKYIKFLRAKNARLEHNEAVREEIEEIQDKQKTDRSEALANEKQTIEKRVKANSGQSRRDTASKL